MSNIIIDLPWFPEEYKKTAHCWEESGEHCVEIWGVVGTKRKLTFCLDVGDTEIYCIKSWGSNIFTQMEEVLFPVDERNMDCLFKWLYE